MDKEVLERVSHMMRAGDPEMRRLGETIYIESKPTPEDMCTLNECFGHEPLQSDEYFYLKGIQLLAEINNSEDVLI